jgi:NADPH-dependent 2,4-dienoyl-CoA reductase/sulfur reductase-like enzyme
MPYYIGDVIKDERKLTARTPEKFRESGIEVLINTRVEQIDPVGQVVRLDGGATLPYDFLALGTGAASIMPGIPGEDMEGVFILKRLSDALRIKDYLKETPCRKAIIIGAGFIGMEVCEAFVTKGIATEIVLRGKLPVNRWDPELGLIILDELKKHDVAFTTDTEIRSIEKGSAYRLRLNTNHGPTEGDLILLAVGVKPDTTLARAMGLALGKSGAIAVNFSQQTSVENIYAAGDCCESFNLISKRWGNIPLGDIANKQGRVAGSNIGGKPMLFPGVVGAQSFRIFSLEAAATGLTEQEARASGFHPVSVISWGNAIANAMPDPKKIGLKLIADRATARLIGAQAVGEAGVVSRINTLSATLWSGLGLEEIGYLDLAYAPPFSGSWDIIHNAAQALLRKL